MAFDRTELQSPLEKEKSQGLSLERTEPPLKIPGFEPVRLLGQGSYGEVWLARERNTNKRVAIKFYTRRGGVDWGQLSREVEKLAFLAADRYVVQLVEVGWDADPPFYIMEYLEHGSLEDRLDEQGTLPAEDAIELFREIAVGLVHSHNKGVLHCDLKPANVLLDQDQKPRLCDFGQSRLTNDQTPSLGTLFYMAPEQANLAAVPDARWDVYALGALLYSMLTGAPPHRSQQTIDRIEAADSLEDRLRLYRRIIEDSPKPNLHRQVPGVDRSLAEIIDRCLAARPVRRYANVQLLIDDLDAWKRRKARRPLLVMGTLGPLLLLSVVGVLFVQVFRTAERESTEALTQRAMENKQLSSAYAAGIVATKIGARWQVLEDEAERLAKELEQGDDSGNWLAANAGKRDGAQAIGLKHIDASASAAQNALANPAWDWLRQVKERHDAALPAASWFIQNDVGLQLGRAPYDQATVLSNYAYRNYFHGGDGDLLPAAAQGQEIKPITSPRLSNVFVSKASGNPMVAFSVPVWSSDRKRVLGVLAMTVELGGFTEVLHRNDDVVTSLVDTRLDSPNDPAQPRRAGALLEHPVLSARVARGERPEQVYLYERVQEGIAEVCQPRRVELTPEEKARIKDEFIDMDDYRDPVPGESFHGDWLASIKPVVWNGEYTGWATIVQEKKDEALEPVRTLTDRLRRQAIIGAIVVLMVLALLWTMVLLMLRGSSSRLLARIRRSLGLTTRAPSGSAASAGTGSVRGKPYRTMRRAEEATSKEDLSD